MAEQYPYPGKEPTTEFPGKPLGEESNPPTEPGPPPLPPPQAEPEEEEPEEEEVEEKKSGNKKSEPKKKVKNRWS